MLIWCGRLLFVTVTSLIHSPDPEGEALDEGVGVRGRRAHGGGRQGVPLRWGELVLVVQGSSRLTPPRKRKCR